MNRLIKIIAEVKGQQERTFVLLTREDQEYY